MCSRNAMGRGTIAADSRGVKASPAGIGGRFPRASSGPCGRVPIRPQ